jgi:hypothetical protein
MKPSFCCPGHLSHKKITSEVDVKVNLVDAIDSLSCYEYNWKAKLGILLHLHIFEKITMSKVRLTRAEKSCCDVVFSAWNHQTKLTSCRSSCDFVSLAMSTIGRSNLAHCCICTYLRRIRCPKSGKLWLK